MLARAMGRARLRDLGIVPGRLPPGPRNGITDVPGVRVGHATIIEGDGKLVPGRGPIRTGVTVILPHGDNLFRYRVQAAIEILNGSGEVTGREFVDEMGELDAPIFITGSLNVARVMDAAITYMIQQNPGIGIDAGFVHPVVCECADAFLNDMQGRHVREHHVLAALAAATDEVQEGCIGAGTGMLSYQFKSGVGTASRICAAAGERYVVGVLVVPNHGLRQQLRVLGVPVGAKLSTPVPNWSTDGSIVIVVATNAPLTARQLKRLAKRAGLGLARTGSVARNGSGDMLIAFSTGNRIDRQAPVRELRMLNNACLDELFEGVVEATEEAILNALTMAEPMTGRDGHYAPAIDLEELRALLQGR